MIKNVGLGIGLGLNYKLVNQIILTANYSYVSGDNKFFWRPRIIDFIY